MSRQEKYGYRDLTYSIWHRKLPEDWLKVIDLDHILWVEFEKGTNDILVFVEEAQDVGQYKPTTVSARVGAKAEIPVYRLLWTKEDYALIDIKCPMCLGTGQYHIHDIEQFRVKLVYPNRGQEKILTPKQWHEHLKELRKQSFGKRKRGEKYNPKFWALEEID